MSELVESNFVVAPRTYVKAIVLYSPFQDFAAFLLPLICSFSLLGIYFLSGFPLWPEQVPLWLALFLNLGINFPHTFSTVFRTYLDTQQLREKKKLLILLPIIIFIFNFTLLSISMTFFLHCLAYLAFYHGMRQDYGWVRLAAGKAQETSLFDQYLNGVMAHFTHGIPLLWLLSRKNNGIWFTENDFPHLFPEWVGSVALVLYAMISIIFILRQIWFYKTKKIFNLPKNFIILSAGITWYLTIVVFEMRSIFQIIVPTLIHSIPYSIFLFRYRTLRLQENRSQNWWRVGLSGTISIYLLFIALGAFHQQLLKIVNANFASTSVIGIFFISLFALPQNLHYVIDGFIWRPSKDLKLRQSLKKI